MKIKVHFLLLILSVLCFSACTNYQAEQHYQSGLQLAEQKQYPQAIEEYSKAIEFNPNYDLAYFERGYAKLELNKYQTAIQDFSIAISINQSNELYYINRGYARSKLRDYHGALKDTESAIAINPSNKIALGNIKVFQSAVKCGRCGGSGRCTRCASRGETRCPWHDKNRNGSCWICGSDGWVRCKSCSGSGLCRSCGGSGQR